jgi:prephenate dehydratase
MDANTHQQDQVDALKAHADALKQVGDELKRQTDFAQAVSTTEAFQIKKMLTDTVAGGMGALVAQRSADTGVRRGGPVLMALEAWS